MKTRERLPATRSSLVRARRRLDQVEKGAALLKRKRESLVEELFDRARPAVSSREAIEQQARLAWRTLWETTALEGRAGLAPWGWPSRAVKVELEPFELWGLKAVALVEAPQVVRSVIARGALPTSDEASTQVAAREFEALVEQLVTAAPEEQVMRRLGQALARTTRLVNTLEQRVAVELSSQLAAIRRTLEEREREEHLRLKHTLARRRGPSM